MIIINNMTSKERSKLKSVAMTTEAILNIGKDSLSDEFIGAVDEALEARELVKINVLKNCADDIRALAEAVAENTDSEVVQTIGRKIVVYRQAREPQNRHNYI